MGMAKPPSWPMGVVWPPSRAKNPLFIFFFLFGPWGWFSHPQGPKTQKKLFSFYSPQLLPTFCGVSGYPRRRMVFTHRRATTTSPSLFLYFFVPRFNSCCVVVSFIFSLLYFWVLNFVYPL
jgi:hypothetical protein